LVGGGPADCATRQRRATATIKTPEANEIDLRIMDALEEIPRERTF
jgi:hypothetical protein